MIPRDVRILVDKALNQTNKIILLLGARQVGKTTLVKTLQNPGDLFLNCDIEEDRDKINTTSLQKLQKNISGYQRLFIDEAQGLDNPGLTLKILYDNFKNIRILATGSSSFELKNSLSDALTGRYLDFELTPLSLSEIAHTENYIHFIDDLMLFGGFPEVFLERDATYKKKQLEKIVESYLFKDILAFNRIRNAQAIKELTQALAYQVGSEVNENELSNRLKIDRKTVLSYLDILEKSFVIRRVYPYSKNPRREIGRKYKIYFYDLGLRNALLGDFNPLHIRQDIGALWENFMIMERYKKMNNSDTKKSQHFWRSYTGAEVDYIEDNPLAAFEFKYSGTTLSQGSMVFEKTYNTRPLVINKDSLHTFLF
ncbi:ATP-binding protein [Candidatus Gottesmanbacteria bacterium]|nr:ATP-binding protein [Candidatus Gottesmanbacteria bacterium]